MLIGLAFGVAVRWLLSWMRQRDAGRDQQICLTLAVAYLSFYVANNPANVSGLHIIACSPYGPRFWHVCKHFVSVFLSVCLSACLPVCLPACLPGCMEGCQPCHVPVSSFMGHK